MTNCNLCPSNHGCTKEKDNCMIYNNPMNKIGKVIGVMSGKGGVGKSTISVLIAKQLNELGYRVGILDADITGPSIPRLVGLNNEKANIMREFIEPVTTKDGIKVMSLNLLIENEEEPVLWRGPIISNTVKQFWSDVKWGELDYLIIDMPPGTSDVALTVMQSIPISGMVVISVPQDLVSMIVAKAINMNKKMNINIIGIIQNMSYVMCPKCGEKMRIFNENNTEKFLVEQNLKLLGELPMIESISSLANSDYNKIKDDISIVFDNILVNILNGLKEDK